MKFANNFTTINEDIRNKVTKKVDELNCDVVFMCRLNNHPDEYDKLFMVIGRYKTPHQYFDGQYAVWTATLFDERASLCYGHYHIDFKTALDIVGERVRDCNKEE